MVGIVTKLYKYACSYFGHLNFLTVLMVSMSCKDTTSYWIAWHLQRLFLIFEWVLSDEWRHI